MTARGTGVARGGRCAEGKWKAEVNTTVLSMETCPGDSEESALTC